MPPLRTTLPPTHAHLLPPLFDRSLPEESLATCDRCVMARADIPPEHTPEGLYRPDVKCCGFHPNLPNFLVGAILADETPALQEGKARIQAKVASRLGVSPVWLSAPRKYTLLFLASRKTSFGRSLLMRCPYYDGERNLCSIWRHRDAVCTSFYCKHVRGPAGERAWRALEAVLRIAERRLAEHAAKALGVTLLETPTALDSLTLEELEDRPPEAHAYADLWQGYVGKEEAYYIACKDIVESLDADSAKHILYAEDFSLALAKAESAVAEALAST